MLGSRDSTSPPYKVGEVKSSWEKLWELFILIFA